MHFSTLFAITSTLATFANAHPGANIAEELEERKIGMQGLPRDLSHCAAELEARGFTAESAKRRANMAREARRTRDLDVGKS